MTGSSPVEMRALSPDLNSDFTFKFGTPRLFVCGRNHNAQAAIRGRILLPPPLLIGKRRCSRCRHHRRYREEDGRRNSHAYLNGEYKAFQLTPD
jgi:hypothetical protein